MLRVYCAVSLDGFIAGPNDELDFLKAVPTESPSHENVISFESFLAHVKVIVMGRRTFDQVIQFDPWPYGKVPVWVVTRRPLPDVSHPIRALQGDVAEICQQAQAFAGAGDVYLDGGHVISDAIEQGCVDEMILTQIPLLLGAGRRLYRQAPVCRWQSSQLGYLGQAAQFRLVPAASAPS